MPAFRYTILPILLATIWISISEFVRNELLFNDYWVHHYAKLGLTFPADPINGIVWGLWSLCFAIGIYVISRKFTLWPTFLLSWWMGFVLMWLVVGNMAVLPFDLLWYAVPLSLLEAGVASWLIHSLSQPARAVR